MKVFKKISLGLAFILILIIIVGAVTVWSYLNRQANENKKYSGAKFIDYQINEEDRGSING